MKIWHAPDHVSTLYIGLASNQRIGRESLSWDIGVNNGTACWETLCEIFGMLKTKCQWESFSRHRCRAIPRIPRYVLMTGGVEVTGSMMIFDRFNHKR